MKLWLRPHPTTTETPLISLRVHVSRMAHGDLLLSFLPAGKIEDILWPGNEPSGWEHWERADELWKHSCFEAFASVDNERAYFETNFNTAGQWAAYGFYDYRQGMRPAHDLEIVRANWRIRKNQAELHVRLRPPSAYLDTSWRLGLSAVIESKDGTKSYWALHHPDPDKPDFHHPDCFTLELPPPSAT